MNKIIPFILLLMIFALAGCAGDEAEATPFVIQDPATDVPLQQEQSDDAAVQPTEPPPATETPPPPTEAPTDTPTPTATPTETPTATLVISTVPADETPLQPGIKATPDLTDPDIAATVLPILTAFPDLGIDDIDLDALPPFPEDFEIPELPPLPALPGG